MGDNRPWKIQWPKGLKEYILQDCAKDYYMFFSTKAGRAACTHCGAEFDLKKLPAMKHDATGAVRISCPECGEMVTPKDMRYGRKKLTDRGRVTWMRGYGSVTFVETDYFVIDYKMPHPTLMISPDMQLRLSAKSQQRFDWHTDWYTGWYSKEREGEWGRWQEVKDINLKAKPQSGFCSRYEIHDHLYMPETGPDIGTDLRYADLTPDRYDNNFCSDDFIMIHTMIRYMADFLKYPATELLEKAGFDGIVMSRASGARSRYLNMRGKDLRKILKLNGGDVKEFRKLDPVISTLEDVHLIRSKAPWAKMSDIRELRGIVGRWMPAERLTMIEAHTDISKLLKKLLEEMRATGDHITLNDYSDYLSAVLKLGWNLDKQTLYPKNFLEAHDRAIEEAKEREEEINAVNFSRFQEEITGMTGPFILDGLLIRPARSAKELAEESRQLHHCVRTYARQVSEGITSIMFIRKEEEPEKPYFTLELNRKGMVVQCRGNRNCSYPEEVADFIDKWKAWRKKERIGA